MAKGPISRLLQDWMNDMPARLESRGADRRPHAIPTRAGDNILTRMISGLSQTLNTTIRARWGGGGDEGRQRQCFKDRVLQYIAASGFRTAVKIALGAGADVNSQSDLYLN